MKITFWGSTDDVTGSMTYLHTEEGHVIVDCGLIQGEEEKAKKIYSLNPPVKASDVNAIIITHAHLDHTGLIPKMVRDGFRGRIYCTPATSQLMQIILMDSAKLNEDKSFFDTKDVTISSSLIQKVDWNQVFELIGVNFHFVSAGHILGASSLVLEKNNKKIVFSGDLGRVNDPILLPHPPCPEADVVIMESTYGDRNRKDSIEDELEKFLIKVANEKRIGIIASFAVARAQTILTLIHRFHDKNPDLKVRVVMDSPMMKATNNVYKRYKHLTQEANEVFDALDDIDAIEYQKEWESLKIKSGPLVIVASSGMLTGGRISRHLFNWHKDKNAILLLAGFQGLNTPGRRLLEGERKLIGPDDEMFEWQGEIWHSDAFSSHADQGELLEWIKPSKMGHVFLLHGDELAKKALCEKLIEVGVKKVTIPRRGETFEI